MEAEESYREAIRINPNYFFAYNNLGLLLEEQERYDEAESVYRQAIRLNPNIIDAYESLGQLLLGQEQYGEAEKIFEEFVRVDQNNVLGRFYLGISIVSQERYEESEEIFEAILSSPQPRNTLGYIGLGILYQEQNRLLEAISFYEKALEILPEVAFVHDSLAEAKRELSLQENPSANLEEEVLPANDPLLPVLRSIVRVATGINSTFEVPKYGTGWVVKREGNRIWILTNRHVVSQPLLEIGTTTEEQQRFGPLSTDVAVDFYSEPPDGSTWLRRPAQVIEATVLEDDLDLALLVVENVPNDIQPLKITTETISLDTTVRIYGHHDGIPWGASAPGNVSARPQGSEIRIVGADGVGRGSSGSPILNEQYEVVGIISDIEPPDFGGGTDVLGGFSIGHPSPTLEEMLIRWDVF